MIGGMTMPVIGVAFTAFCVWLGVRIVNRRERWAKWTAGAVALSVLYVLAFSPLHLLYHSVAMPNWAKGLMLIAYYPLDAAYYLSPEPIRKPLDEYDRLWMKNLRRLSDVKPRISQADPHSDSN
jgi:hypothetical protein